MYSFLLIFYIRVKWSCSLEQFPTSPVQGSTTSLVFYQQRMFTGGEVRRCIHSILGEWAVLYIYLYIIHIHYDSEWWHPLRTYVYMYYPGLESTMETADSLSRLCRVEGCVSCLPYKSHYCRWYTYIYIYIYICIHAMISSYLGMFTNNYATLYIMFIYAVIVEI